MKYKRQIFKKNVVLSAAIITLSFLLLGFIMMFFLSDYWMKDKSKTLSTTAQSTSNLLQNNLFVSDSGMYISNFNIIQSMIDIVAQTNDVDIIVADKDGSIILSSRRKGDIQQQNRIDKEIIDEWLKNPKSRNSDLGGFYPSPRIVCSYPVQTTPGANGSVRAVTFIATNSHFMNMFFSDTVTAILLVFIGVFLVSSVIIVLLNYYTFKPVKQIAKAVESFTKGDFSQRVYIKRNDEIGELATTFNNMAQTLSESENIRRTFISNVSHELKTPMTTISGFVDGIIDETIPPEREKYYLNIVSEETKRLSRLVTMMLELSRIDNDNIKLFKEKVNITEMITKIIFGFEQQIESKNIDVQGLDSLNPTFVKADYDKIYQVVYNLIENAVKFVPNGGYIEIFLKNKGNLTVTIKNSGTGISKDDLPFVFDRFYKTDKSRSKDKKGMGLGLFIVKKLINLHGGDISVDSIEGEYTAFSFWLP